MKKVLVTGSKGFIGKNLIAALSREKDIVIMTFDVEDASSVLETYLMEADFICHLAGVNRPRNFEEFKRGNIDLTASIATILEKAGKKVPILFTSSTQAEGDSPYGVSKKKAEEILADYKKRTGTPIFIYRLPGVFGKWSRPDYNSVVATFCHNIAHGIEIRISDPDNEVELVYIDDVVNHFMRHLRQSLTLVEIGNDRSCYFQINKKFKVKLGDLAAKIYSLRDIRMTLTVPNMSDYFIRCLNATYLSFLDTKDFSYPLDVKTNDRGSLFEFIKSDNFGQIFVSKIPRGSIRGNHYHNTKVEKFCVVQGKAIIKLRSIFSKEVISYNISGDKIEAVDIPPGYAHSIENLMDGEIIVLFWANQIFDPQNPDTYPLEV